MSVPSGAHVLPRWIGGKPYDIRDTNPLNRIPWQLMNLVYGLRVAEELGRFPRHGPWASTGSWRGDPNCFLSGTQDMRLITDEPVPSRRGRGPDPRHRRRRQLRRHLEGPPGPARGPQLPRQWGGH
jgi:hypothetical protein